MTMWRHLDHLHPRSFICYRCGASTGNDRGYWQDSGNIQIFICPVCLWPNACEAGVFAPGPPFGVPINHLPPDVHAVYEEARRAMQARSFTAAVLCCRKLLMHIGAEKEAGADLKFIEYVDFLNKNGYVPPGGREWVDHIRKAGNEATHEIVLFDQERATEVMDFTEMLLRFVYDFPNRLKKAAKIKPLTPAPQTS